MKCGDCKWWVAVYQGPTYLPGMGECHCAPVTIRGWPKVDAASAGCGKHEREKTRSKE